MMIKRKTVKIIILALALSLSSAISVSADNETTGTDIVIENDVEPEQQEEPSAADISESEGEEADDTASDTDEEETDDSDGEAEEEDPEDESDEEQGKDKSGETDEDGKKKERTADDIFDEDAEDAGDEDDHESDEKDESPSKPLFQFNYGGKKIKTYATFSTVGDKMTTTHRYFVKNGKLTVIDQAMNPTPTGVFIHYDDGKSYIVVLCENGQIQSLGTEDVLSILGDFKNGGIRSINENVTRDTSTLLVEYDDGGIAAYNCVTGELIYQKDGRGTEKSAGSTGGSSGLSIVDYAKNFISGIIKSLGVGGGGSSQTTAAQAQSIVDTLTRSGLSLEELAKSGALPGLSFNDSQGGSSDEESAAGSGDQSNDPPTGLPVSLMTPESLIGVGRELTTDEKSFVGGIISRVKDGTESPDKAVEEIKEKIPDLSAVEEAHIKEQLHSIQNSRISEIRESMAADENLYGKGSKGTVGDGAYPTGEGVDGTALGDGTAVGGAEGSGDLQYMVKEGAVPEDHMFITSSTNEEYVAVFNSKEGRYDIYSVGDLLENPMDPESELDKISDRSQVETLVRLLTNQKDKTVSRGIVLYVSIAAAICGIIAIMLIFGRKKNVTEKQKAKQTDKDSIG